MMKTLCIIFLIFLYSCGHVVKGQDRKYYYAGDGWYHPHKTPEEIDHDYYDCHKIGLTAPITYNPITVESHCMSRRGYLYEEPH